MAGLMRLKDRTTCLVKRRWDNVGTGWMIDSASIRVALRFSPEEGSLLDVPLPI